MILQTRFHYFAPSGSVFKKMVYYLSHFVRGWRTEGAGFKIVFKAPGLLKSLCAYCALSLHSEVRLFPMIGSLCSPPNSWVTTHI